MYLLDMSVISELPKLGSGCADANVTVWLAGRDANVAPWRRLQYWAMPIFQNGISSPGSDGYTFLKAAIASVVNKSPECFFIERFFLK